MALAGGLQLAGQRKSTHMKNIDLPTIWKLIKSFAANRRIIVSLLCATAVASAIYVTPPVGSIMIIGDSISQGQTRPEYDEVPWRKSLSDNLVRFGYTPSFVGPFSGTCSPMGSVPKYYDQHMAICGWRTLDLYNYAINNQSTLDGLAPQKIIIASGTNDLGGVGIPGQNGYKAPCSVDEAIQRLQNLVSLQHHQYPAAKIYTATLLPRVGMSTTINEYNSRVQDLVGTLSAQGISIQILDFGLIASEADLHDGIHPKNSLAEKMGLLAFRTLTSRSGWIPEKDD